MSETGIALISLVNNPWALEKIHDGLSSVEWVRKQIDVISISSVYNFVSEEDYNKGFYDSIFNKNIHVKNEIYPFLEQCLKVFESCESIIFIYTDSPLNDYNIVQDLLKQHIEEMAEYSFTENYPEGIGAEILSYKTLLKLKNIASGNNEIFHRGSISKIIHFDINQYDVEVILSEVDTRKERLSLVCNSYLNYSIVQNAFRILSSLGNDFSLSKIHQIITDHPEFMRSVPAYVEIEITNDCNCSCMICPRTSHMKRSVKNMSLDEYKQIIDELKSLCHEVVISLTLMGEPMIHPQFIDMIDYTLNIPGMAMIIETNGIFLNNELSDRFIQYNSDRLIIIVALDSPDKVSYEELRSMDRLNQVENNLAYLIENKPKSTYIQILRLQQNDKQLDYFYKKWDAFKDQIILQKYNSYRNLLPDYKGADLSPLNRFSCLHLKRDLCILADGTVPFCKQDINGSRIIGNVFQDGIKHCWDQLNEYFIKDHQGNLDPFCESCDEWFTYNF